MEPCKVFVDSPMARASTKLYKYYLDENYSGNELDDNLFNSPPSTYATEQSRSVGLNEIKFGAIIISDSAVATGSRVLQHLAHRIARIEVTILIVGFQVKGAKGRDLLE